MEASYRFIYAQRFSRSAEIRYMESTISTRWSMGNNPKDDIALTVLTVTTIVLLISWFTWAKRRINKGKSLPLPPGPRGLPIVGYLPFIKEDLHRCAAKLAKTYGPIFKLQVGSKLMIFVSTPSLAKEVLRDRDAIMANRDMTDTARFLTYGGIDILFSPNGPNHRMIRKVCAREIISSATHNAMGSLRLGEVRRMVRHMYDKRGTPVNVAEQMFVASFNLLTSMLWGVTLEGEEIITSAKFRGMMLEVVELLGKSNVSDLFPILGPLDLQGLARKMKKLSSTLDGIFGSIIEQGMKMNGDGEEKGKDGVQSLLQIMEQEDPKASFTLSHLKVLFVDMLVGGTHTTSTVIEWAITEMIANKDILEKSQKEIAEVVGKENIVEESHIPKLHYVQAVIKEVIRLHPVLPLMVPHCPSESCTLGGFRIPQGCQVLVNQWALHMDPENWPNPLEFQPERFLGGTSKFDYSGNDFRYIPFGSGRRICIGAPLAEKSVMLVFASLLHSFDWHLPEGTTLDFSEIFGLAANKAIPLMAIPKPRLSDPTLYF